MLLVEHWGPSLGLFLQLAFPALSLEASWKKAELILWILLPTISVRHTPKPFPRFHTLSKVYRALHGLAQMQTHLPLRHSHKDPCCLMNSLSRSPGGGCPPLFQPPSSYWFLCPFSDTWPQKPSDKTNSLSTCSVRTLPLLSEPLLDSSTWQVSDWLPHKRVRWGQKHRVGPAPSHPLRTGLMRKWREEP
jgi:hypothetical protein